LQSKTSFPGEGLGVALGEGRIQEVVYRIRFTEGGRPPALIFGLVSKAKAFRVETLATNLDAEGNVWRIVHVQGSTAQDIQEAEQAFLNDKSNAVLENRVLGRQPRRLVVWYKYRPIHKDGRVSLTHLALQSLGPETFITDRTVPNGLEVRILTRPGPKLSKFMKQLEETARKNYDFQLVHVGPPRFTGIAGLTKDEEEALHAAVTNGYLAVPRTGSLEEVAKELGCSESSASARMRRATAKLAAAYFGDDMPAAASGSRRHKSPEPTG
jgi:hypothetical protein